MTSRKPSPLSLSLSLSLSPASKKENIEGKKTSRCQSQSYGEVPTAVRHESVDVDIKRFPSCCGAFRSFSLFGSISWGPADSADWSWSDEGRRGGSEVTWQTVHVIIVISVALWWDGAGEPLVSEATRTLTLPQATPDRHHPHPLLHHLADPGDRSLADGCGVREEEGVRTTAPQLHGSYTLRERPKIKRRQKQ